MRSNVIQNSGDTGYSTRTHASHARCLLAISLFALWPLVNFVNQNREQLDLAGLKWVAFTFALAFSGAALGFLILHNITLRRRRVGAAVSTILFVLLFFNYHLVYDGIVATFSALGLDRGENYAYLILVVIVCLLAVPLADSRRALDFLLCFGLLANVIPGLALLVFVLTANENGAPQATNRSFNFKLVDKPNVFHIILDAYARHDSLLRHLDYDNAGFLEELERRGFYIARKSYANYPSTFLSVSATVSMDYLVTDTTTPFKTRRRFYEAIRGKNPAVETLQKHGYRYVYLGAARGGGSKCPPHVDLCLSTSRAVKQALLALTPLRRFIRQTGPSVPADIAARLDEILSGQPVYVFAHTFPPHPPRTFTAACAEGAGDDRPRALTFWGDREGYLVDLKCANSQILTLVDSILARDPDAVILFHGDHGTAFEVDWSLPIDQWPHDQVEERFAILMALRMPESCTSSLYPSLSPVNLYPLLFACLGHVDPQLEPDKLYVSPFEKHPEYGTAHPYREFESKPTRRD